MRKIVLFLFVVVAMIAGGRVKASAAVIGIDDSLIDPGEVARHVLAEKSDLELWEIELMVTAMELENGMNSDLCLLYTGSVILNRTKAGWCPDTIEGVLLQAGQYADATVKRLYTKRASDRVFALAVRLAIYGSLDEELIFQSMQPHLGKVKYVIDGEYFATAKGK